MFDFQQKRKIKKILYSKVSFVVLLILIFILTRSTYDIYTRERLSAESLDESVREHDSLMSRETHLSASLARLSTDTGAEEEIRSKFGVVRPGEVVVTIIDDATGSSPLEKKGFWESMKSWFAE